MEWRGERTGHSPAPPDLQTYALLLLFVGDELIDGGDVSLGQIHHVKVVALQVVPLT